jgi:hypothetical protein
MEPNKNNNDLVSPVTNQPWPCSHHSDDDYKEKDKTTPLRTKNIPNKIIAPHHSINDTGKKCTLADDDDDVSDIDIVGITNQIKSQERGFAYEQEERVIKEVELVTQNDRAAADSSHVC